MTLKAPDSAHYRQMLEQRRSELHVDLENGADAAATVQLDQTLQGRLSRMDAMQQQAMAKENRRRQEAELKRIAGALRRLEDDEYGYCAGCGEAIDPARLDIELTTRQCIACAEKAEA